MLYSVASTSSMILVQLQLVWTVLQASDLSTRSPEKNKNLRATTFITLLMCQNILKGDNAFTAPLVFVTSYGVCRNTVLYKEHVKFVFFKRFHSSTFDPILYAKAINMHLYVLMFLSQSDMFRPSVFIIRIISALYLNKRYLLVLRLG
jgi:hypothetical protein